MIFLERLDYNEPLTQEEDEMFDEIIKILHTLQQSGQIPEGKGDALISYQAQLRVYLAELHERGGLLPLLIRGTLTWAR